MGFVGHADKLFLALFHRRTTKNILRTMENLTPLNSNYYPLYYLFSDQQGDSSL